MEGKEIREGCRWSYMINMAFTLIDIVQIYIHIYTYINVT